MDQTLIKWMAVTGLDGRYEVSSCGKVRSLVRASRLLSPATGRDGYRRVVLYWSSQEKRSQLVHRLVAQAFIANPSDLPFVNHIDGNKANNHVENLEWCSAAHNIKHAFRSGLNPRRIGERNPASKLSDLDRRVIIKLLSTGMSQMQVAELFEVCQQTISKVSQKAAPDFHLAHSND